MVIYWIEVKKRKSLFLNQEELVQYFEAKTNEENVPHPAEKTEELSYINWPLPETADETKNENIRQLQKKIITNKSQYDRNKIELERQKMATDKSEKIQPDQAKHG